jgi:hypothetical protein
MKLSTPKPTSEMLPAIAPAMMATRPSSEFHAMVKYSSLRPCSDTQSEHYGENSNDDAEHCEQCPHSVFIETVEGFREVIERTHDGFSRIQ